MSRVARVTKTSTRAATSRETANAIVAGTATTAAIGDAAFHADQANRIAERSSGGWFPHRDAERILSERFARGEIDEEEFTRRRDALRR